MIRPKAPHGIQSNCPFIFDPHPRRTQRSRITLSANFNSARMVRGDATPISAGKDSGCEP